MTRKGRTDIGIHSVNPEAISFRVAPGNSMLPMGINNEDALNQPDDDTFLCNERQEAYLKEAFALLGMEANENPEMRIELIMLTWGFVDDSAAFDHEPLETEVKRLAEKTRRRVFAKDEKRNAEQIRNNAERLAQLLVDPPAQVKSQILSELGKWLEGYVTMIFQDQHRSPDWGRDVVIRYLKTLEYIAREYANPPRSSPRPEKKTPQQELINRAVHIALASKKPKDIGKEIAKLAYRAVTGSDPQGLDWGEFHKKRTKRDD